MNKTLARLFVDLVVLPALVVALRKRIYALIERHL